MMLKWLGWEYGQSEPSEGGRAESPTQASLWSFRHQPRPYSFHPEDVVRLFLRKINVNLQNHSVTTSRTTIQTIFMKNWQLTTITVLKIMYNSEYEQEVKKYPGKCSHWTPLLMQSCTTLVSSHQHKTLSQKHFKHIHTHLSAQPLLGKLTTEWLDRELVKKSWVTILSFLILTLKFFLLQPFHRSTAVREKRVRIGLLSL